MEPGPSVENKLQFYISLILKIFNIKPVDQRVLQKKSIAAKRKPPRGFAVIIKFNILFTSSEMQFIAKTMRNDVYSQCCMYTMY